MSEPTRGAPEPTGPAADWPTIPGYEVLGELGRGGMGVVYRARQLTLKRQVALKMIRDGALAGPQQRARFRIEAEAAARMRHANIVAIYEVAEHQGRPYFAMELVEGPSLDRHLAGRPQPAAAAAALLRTLAGAIAHAHAQRIVHRDLKPANILLQRDEGRGARDESPSPLASRPSSLLPKITDFGLAKRLDSESTAWTQEGAVLGTASYMAPEQAAGGGHAIGPAADVYALGAILYQMLTGRPPFVAQSWQETLEQVRRDEPVPPSRLRGDVPAELETICLKCLEKEPAQRYAGAGALADDLGRFLDGKPVAAAPVSAAERLARFAARDGYTLVGEIGRGPRSTVYRARVGAAPQPLAVKVFRAGVCSRSEWEDRVRRDADAWVGLAHPGIVPVQRAGWWDDAPYVVMEYVPHGSLADRIAGKPHPVADALRLVEQLAEIVSYLHRQGIVHGNLKPGNVLLAAHDLPRLSDFRSGAAPAGVGYLAPEAIRDPQAPPRPYTDIYGLGMILYELLTGRPAFAGELAAEPVPPSQLNAHVPPPVEACCLRCLRKDPWQRYTRSYDLFMRLGRLQEKKAR
jgi:serine/threonine protein kinase